MLSHQDFISWHGRWAKHVHLWSDRGIVTTKELAYLLLLAQQEVEEYHANLRAFVLVEPGMPEREALLNALDIRPRAAQPLSYLED